MNRIVFLFLIAVVAILLGSCTKDTENTAPLLESITVSKNVVSVLFSEAVWANNDMTGALTNECLNITIPDVTFTYEVAHVPGSAIVWISLITSIVPDSTQITVTTIVPIFDDKEAIFDSGYSVSAYLVADLGIIGRWQSSELNVAPSLANLSVDSVSAEFKEDSTYVVHQFNIDNTSETPDKILSGTYTSMRSGYGDIWNIELNQVEPEPGSLSGIFEVKEFSEVLWYEVVQASDTHKTPIAEAGFGSSDVDGLGDLNIQKFVRIE